MKFCLYFLLDALVSKFEFLMCIGNPLSGIVISFRCAAADRSACTNAATLALTIAGIPRSDNVTSYSAGYLNGASLLEKETSIVYNFCYRLEMLSKDSILSW
ncbi:exosome complex component RRP41 homolog isoform X1 [Benincasa hispida]|uniref:exosome complex component RRP41 homolog isoform X1 n=1 Tax=Benincasa hispida TaxID=102211 RepID=UPI001900B3EB|nr:exosome complex component RRP41 homolog isoform X1 [Benincasa hispida]